MALSQEKRQKKIAVINDFSGYGRCSITVALPIISALKVQYIFKPYRVFKFPYERLYGIYEAVLQGMGKAGTSV